MPSVALVPLLGASNKAGDFRILVGGARPAPPYGTVDVGTEASPARIAAFRVPDMGSAEEPTLIACDDDQYYPLLASELDADASSVTTGLDQAGKQKFLDFLLGFCCPAFRLGHSAEFAQACRRLALDCVEVTGRAIPLAQLMPTQILVEGVRPHPDSTLLVIGRSAVTRSRAPTLQHEAGLQAIPRTAPGDLVVAMGSRAGLWEAVAGQALPHVLAMRDTTSVTAAAARGACRSAFAGSRSGAARALLRDIDLLYPPKPQRLTDLANPLAGDVELALSDHAGGVFLAGWLRDPLDQIETLLLATPDARLPLGREALCSVRRPDVEKLFKASVFVDGRPNGFVLHVPELPGGPTLQPSLLLRLRSGAEIRLTPIARSLPPAEARHAVLGSVPQGQLTPEIMRRCIAPATARLHRAAMSQLGSPEVTRIGSPTAQPAVSIIVPIYRNLSFLRLQIASLAEDPKARGSQLIFVLDSPEQRQDVEHLLRGLHRLTAMPMTLAVMPGNFGYAAACNAGARHASAPALLLLNSDVIPAAPGWLSVLMAPLADPEVKAVGPKLLFEDGSIQHAGLYFERDDDGLWFNRHYHKGMPRHWPAANTRCTVPGVTGAALLVRRDMFEWVGGISEDYVIGDYEDSDFCLRLRESGGRAVYAPKAELFHFERRSIQMHQGYTQTHASLYNRLLHHQRWDASMAAAMAEAAAKTRRRSL